MKAIALPRMGGKTHQMLRWLLADRTHVLVVMSVRERDRLAGLLRSHDPLRALGHKPEEASRIVAISEVLNGSTRGRWHRAVYGIDELEFVLQQILSGPVEVVTFTGTIEGSTNPVGAGFQR